jgi:5-methylcytosine-specific restriction endonuclease McrA
MPIRPENRKRYPKEWPKISRHIRDRANNKCEFCGVANGTIRDAVKIVLTVAHLDHTPENCADDNLKALCQKCHNGYDAQTRANGIKQRNREKCALGDLFNGG